MIEDLYCSMIHGGLNLDFKHQSHVKAQHCCLRKDLWKLDDNNLWAHRNFISLREINQKNQWAPGCDNCEKLEKAGLTSFRNGMNAGLNILGQTNLKGPSRIDLMFDISCNLACRTCGPESSTLWQKHLKEINEWNTPIFTPRNRHDVIAHLQQLDLTNLKQVVFCGGETLLGQEYWHVTEWLADNVPNAKQQLTICFQTNGTQPITQKNYDVIGKLHLVKLHVSIDSIGTKFEYLRWPASWNQVVDNIQNIRATCPSNVMFVIEETISIFNVVYLDETESWVKEHFHCNREGDVINHTRHLAHGIFSLAHASQELADLTIGTQYANLISRDWNENVEKISFLLMQIKKFDAIRKQSFKQIFPKVYDAYHRFW